AAPEAAAREGLTDARSGSSQARAEPIALRRLPFSPVPARTVDRLAAEPAEAAGARIAVPVVAAPAVVVIVRTQRSPDEKPRESRHEPVATRGRRHGMALVIPELSLAMREGIEVGRLAILILDGVRIRLCAHLGVDLALAHALLQVLIEKGALRGRRLCAAGGEERHRAHQSELDRA